jgi:gliding motility-associated-like protein
MASYTWTPARDLSCTTCPQPVASNLMDRLYKTTFIDSNGCENIGTILVRVLCKGTNVFVPNTFSPNGDGNNDFFYPRGTGLNRAKVMRVFNRWGEIVFERNDFPVNNPAYGWDGKMNGQTVNGDVYVYQVEIYCENGQLIKFSGNVALIK